MREFEPTPEGCTEARKYLIENGKEWLISHELSTDGYTIVHLANQLLRELDE